MLDNLLIKKTPLGCWNIRKVLENNSTFDEAVEHLSTV